MNIHAVTSYVPVFVYLFFLCKYLEIELWVDKYLIFFLFNVLRTCQITVLQSNYHFSLHW